MRVRSINDSYFSIFLYVSFSLFFKQEMELSLVGLQNAGKTSLVNSIAVSFMHCKSPRNSIQYNSPSALMVVFLALIFEFFVQTGGYSEDMIPTVGIFPFDYVFNCMFEDSKNSVCNRNLMLAIKTRLGSTCEKLLRGV